MAVVNPGLGADIPINKDNSSYFQGGVCDKSLGVSLEGATAAAITWLPFTVTNKLLAQKYQARQQMIQRATANLKPRVPQRASYPGVI